MRNAAQLLAKSAMLNVIPMLRQLALVQTQCTILIIVVRYELHELCDWRKVLEPYGTLLRFPLQQDFTTAQNCTMEVSLRLRIVRQKKRKMYLLKVNACARGVHLLLFMLINGLHVHTSLIEEFQTLKNRKKDYFILYVMFHVIMTSGPMVQHSMVGPGRCTQ